MLPCGGSTCRGDIRTTSQPTLKSTLKAKLKSVLNSIFHTMLVGRHHPISEEVNPAIDCWGP